MRLIIHPGYPKTATTWLQTHALPQAGVWQLGKGSAGDGSEEHWSPGARELQYRVFSPISGPASMWERFRTSGPAVRALADALAQELNTAASGGTPESAARQGVRNTEIAVLSDETILAYGGAEIGTPLLSWLATTLHDRLDDPDGTSIEIVLTIREQAGLLQSFFAYDFAHQREFFRDFDQFVEAGIADPHAGLFGWVFYDDLFELLASVLPPSVRVRAVPYELLSVDGPDAFVRAFLGAAAPAVRQRSGDDPAAPSSAVNRQSDSGYRLRDFPRGQRIAAQVRRRAAALAPPPLDRVVAAGLGRWAASSSSMRLLRQRAELNSGQQQRIRAVYAESNRAVAERFGLDLERLGYAVEATASSSAGASSSTT